MEWTAPGIVLSASAYGEGDAVVHVLTEAHGAYRGLARGGLSRSRAALWQPGNLLSLRWVARLPDQLGSITGEMVHAAAARVLAVPPALAMLCSCCAVADGALPEREPHPAIFDGLLALVTRLSLMPEQEAGACRAILLRWEVALLAELGFGLDLAACAVSGEQASLAYVSPRTGRAISAAAAGGWAPRLLRLPAVLVQAQEDAADNDTDTGAGPGAGAEVAVDAADWADGLRLTGHFLARDVFGHRHRPLPAARQRLADTAEAAARRDEVSATGP